MSEHIQDARVATTCGGEFAVGCVPFSVLYFLCAQSASPFLAGIWSRPVSEDDLLKWESLAIGPALSPYAFGFFTFRMQVRLIPPFRASCPCLVRASVCIAQAYCLVIGREPADLVLYA